MFGSLFLRIYSMWSQRDGFGSRRSCRCNTFGTWCGVAYFPDRMVDRFMLVWIIKGDGQKLSYLGVFLRADFLILFSCMNWNTVFGGLFLMKLSVLGAYVFSEKTICFLVGTYGWCWRRVKAVVFGYAFFMSRSVYCILPRLIAQVVVSNGWIIFAVHYHSW